MVITPLRQPAFARRWFGDDPAGDARYAGNVLFVVSLSTVLTALSGGLLNISLPVVVRYFHASALQASWLLLGSMLTVTALIIMFGRLADIFGRRPMYLTGAALMTVSSLAAAVAPDVTALIVVRIVQAVGVAMLLANLAAMLALTFPPERLPKVMGIYMSALSAATLAGPPVGAILAETVGWRWIFGLQVPIGAFCLIWAASTLRPMPAMSQHRERLDVPGTALVALTLSALVIGLSELQTSGLRSPLVIGGFVVFAIGLPLFVLVEHRTRAPLIELKLFAKASIAAANAAMFFGNMARWAAEVLGGLYFQAVNGDSALTAAVKVLPMPICTTLAGLAMGRISRWGSQRAIAVTAAWISTGGVVLLLFAFGGGAPYPVVGLGFLILGIGGGTFMPANTTAILQEVPKERLGVVNAVRMMLMSSGGLLSTALGLALITSTLPFALHSAVFAGTVSKVGHQAVVALRAGYSRAMLALLLLSVIGAVSAMLSKRAHERSAAAAAAAPPAAPPGELPGQGA
jgi:EmrB/QacA subfamily drug resistance transporter